MSDRASIANFYVDRDGVERPIQYPVHAIVNHRPPTGHHWERVYMQVRDYSDPPPAGSTQEDIAKWLAEPKPLRSVPTDLYIVVKNPEPEEEANA